MLKQFHSALGLPQSVLKSQTFWLMVGLILLGKIAWFGFHGVLVEMDSYGYLNLQAGLYHPPGYNLFTTGLFGLFGRLEAIVFFQSLLFSLSVSLFISQQFKRLKWKFGAALLLAVEPCTGLMCSSIMTESLFISILFLIFTCLPLVIKTNAGKELFWAGVGVGLMCGLSYMIRYTAPLLLLVIVVWLITKRFSLKRIILTFAWIILGFQISTLPLRAYFLVKYDSFSFNSFANLSIWNSAAYLYPGSALAEKPQNEFEKSLATFPDSTYAMKSSLYTSHIFNPRMPFQSYVKGRGPSQFIANSALARNAGLKLILAQPSRHIKDLVLPNWTRPLGQDEQVDTNFKGKFFFSRFNLGERNAVNYYASIWAVLLLILVFSSIASLFKRKANTLWLLLLFSWAYLFAISLLGVVFLRFLYLLSPFILLIALLVLANWFPIKKT